MEQGGAEKFSVPGSRSRDDVYFVATTEQS